MKKNVEEYLAFKNGEIRMPSHLKARKEEKGRLHESEFMERITATPIYIPQVVWLIVIAMFIWWSLTKTSLLIWELPVLVFAGFFTWTLFEYLIHRFGYHTETNSDRLVKVQFNAHGNHHWYPKDPDRIAMPPLHNLILSAIFLGIFYLIMGDNTFAFFPGFIIGYLAYITLHYFQHRWKSPKYKPWRRLWTHHKAHHYSNPYSAFGVTTRLWDWVFGTMPKKVNKAKVERAKDNS
ncbi:sterol desaturase family protein [Bacteroidota bacterium]